MKTITLDSLDIRDFQGGTFHLDAGGQNVDISGNNGVGKTRLVSAFMWLMFGKDSLGRSDFSIKNLDSNGDALHNLEHEVSATLSVNGQPVGLRRVLKEKWTKKRGYPTPEFTGHETKFYVNDVPLPEKEYQQRVADLVGDENRFRLITSPTAFPALPWQKQREILIDLVGDVNTADIVAENPSLAPITGLLEKVVGSKKPFDDLKAMLANQRKKVNADLEAIPVRIDEVRRGLPDVTGLNEQALATEIDRLQTAIADARLRKQGVDTGGAIADLLKTLEGIKADISRLETDHYNTFIHAIQPLKTKRNDAVDQLNRIRKRIAEVNTELARKTRQAEDLGKSTDEIRESWYKVDGEKFADTTATQCAACGQGLPVDKVSEARSKALADFNESKARRLDQITRQGQTLKEEHDALLTAIATLQTELETLKSDLEKYGQEVTRLDADIQSGEKTASDYSQVPGHADLVGLKAEIDRQIAEARQGTATDSGKIDSEIKGLESRLSVSRGDHGKFQTRRDGDQRMADLMAEEKRLAAEFERILADVSVCEQFIRARVSMLTDRINGSFEIVRFKLFNTLINQGIEETCEIMVNGVGYNSGLNSAARTNAGLDIVKTLQRHYGVYPVVFCDNAESVVNLLPMECQVIRLVVSGEDKTLRVEVARERAYAA